MGRTSSLHILCTSGAQELFQVATPLSVFEASYVEDKFLEFYLCFSFFLDYCHHGEFASSFSSFRCLMLLLYSSSSMLSCPSNTLPICIKFPRFISRKKIRVRHSTVVTRCDTCSLSIDNIYMTWTDKFGILSEKSTLGSRRILKLY